METVPRGGGSSQSSSSLFSPCLKPPLGSFSLLEVPLQLLPPPPLLYFHNSLHPSLWSQTKHAMICSLEVVPQFRWVRSRRENGSGVGPRGTLPPARDVRLEQQCFFCQPSAGKPNNCSQKSYKTRSLLVLILCQLFASYNFHYGNSNLPELLLNFRKEERGNLPRNY